MKTLIEHTKLKLDKVIDHLKTQLASIRSGRVAPSLVENIKVEAYGSMTPLIELASITSPEPRLLLISPWDKSLLKEIEKSLLSANLGVQPAVDGNLIRLNFPPLTEERRRELSKTMNIKLEEAKVGVRNVREEVLKDLKEKKNSGQISEDDFFLAQKELQKLIDEYNKIIKDLGQEKEKEIMTV